MRLIKQSAESYVNKYKMKCKKKYKRNKDCDAISKAVHKYDHPFTILVYMYTRL